MRLPAILQETLTLRPPRGRLLAFAVLSLAIFFSHYSWLAHLSLWQALGWHWAPSIGLTRAYWLLIHGHPVAAWHRNPLIYAVLAAGLPLLIKDAYSLLRHAIIAPDSNDRALVAQLAQLAAKDSNLQLYPADKETE